MQIFRSNFVLNSKHNYSLQVYFERDLFAASWARKTPGALVIYFSRIITWIINYKRIVFCTVFLFCFTTSFAHEYYVTPKGDDRNIGSKSNPFLTISQASKIASPGDVITVHAGIYRELVAPSVGGTSDKMRIVYRAAAGEKVEIRGSEVVKGWKRIGAGVWELVLPDAFFEGYNPYRDLIYGDWFFPGKRRLHTGEMYLNGKALFETISLEKVLAGASEAAPVGLRSGGVLSPVYTWACEHSNGMTVITANFQGHDPNQEMVEISVRPSCFYPAKTGVNYITVSGFHFSQAATQWAAPTAEQVGMIGTNWSKGWIIEDCVLSDSKCVGITLGKDRASGQNVWSANPALDGSVLYNQMVERVIAAGWNKENIGSHIVRRNTIFNCGAAGICGSFGAAFSQITGNHIYDVYTRRPFWGAEMAGIKIHAAVDVLITDNEIHNTNIGIWLDWMAQGTRVSGNRVYDSDYVDFFAEVNHGPYLVDNNRFESAFALKDWSEGGAYVFNRIGGLVSRAAQVRATPFFKPHSTVLVKSLNIRGGNNWFYGNVFAGNMGKPYQKPLGIYMPEDAVDPDSGYGLAVYDHSELPVVASGNTYLSGASPYRNELLIKYKSITTALLGRTALSAQGFENPDGSPLKILNKTTQKNR